MCFIPAEFITSSGFARHRAVVNLKKPSGWLHFVLLDMFLNWPYRLTQYERYVLYSSLLLLQWKTQMLSLCILRHLAMNNELSIKDMSGIIFVHTDKCKTALLSDDVRYLFNLDGWHFILWQAIFSLEYYFPSGKFN